MAIRAGAPGIPGMTLRRSIAGGLIMLLTALLAPAEAADGTGPAWLGDVPAGAARQRLTEVTDVIAASRAALGSGSFVTRMLALRPAVDTSSVPGLPLPTPAEVAAVRHL